jgi:hypothetical protein
MPPTRDLKDFYALRLNEALEIVARTSDGEIRERWQAITEGYRYLMAAAEARTLTQLDKT